MDPRQFVELVNTLQRTAAALASAELVDVPASLVAQAIPTLCHAATLAENASALASRRVETSGVWAESGARTAASWVAQETGLSLTQAHARLDAGRVVDEHTAFATSFRAGATGVGHLTAVRRLLSGPGSVKRRRREAFGDFAVALAQAAEQCDSGRFAKVLDGWAGAIDHEETRRQAELSAWRSRYLTFTELGDECLLEARLPIADGRLLKRRLEALVDAHFRRPTQSPLGRDPQAAGAEPLTDAPSDAPPLNTPSSNAPLQDSAPSGTPRSALMLDAFLHLAALGAANPGAAPIVDGAVPHIWIVVTEERMRRRRRDRAGPGAGTDPSPPQQHRGASAVVWEGERSVPISDAQARRHACGDAEVSRLVLDADSVVADVGRTKRIVPREMRQLVALRDGSCRFPGCRVPSNRCEVHHVVHWVDGGATNTATLAAVCHVHHRLVHEGGIEVTGDADERLVFAQGGAELGRTTPRPVLPRLPVARPTARASGE